MLIECRVQFGVIAEPRHIISKMRIGNILVGIGICVLAISDRFLELHNVLTCLESEPGRIETYLSVVGYDTSHRLPVHHELGVVFQPVLDVFEIAILHSQSCHELEIVASVMCTNKIGSV